MSITSDSIPQLRRAAIWNGHTTPLAVLKATDEHLIGGGRAGILYRWQREIGDSTPERFSTPSVDIHDVVEHEGYLIGAYSDSFIRVWDVESGKLHATWAGHRAPVQAVLAHGDTIYSAGEGGLVIAWGLDGSKKWAQDVPSGGLTSLALHEDFLAVGCQAGTLHLFEPTSGEHITAVVAHDGPTVSVHIHPNHNWLLTAGSGTIRDWSWDGEDLHDGAVEIHLPRLKAAQYTPDGGLIIALSSAPEQNLTAWHSEDGRLAGILAPRADAFTATEEAIYRAGPHMIEGLMPDPAHITDADGLQELRAPLIAKNAWRLRPLATLIGHGGAVNAIAAAPDASYFASASVDRTVRIWHGMSGENIAILRGHSAEVRDIDISPDGVFVASASGDVGQRTDDSVRVWLVETGQLVEHLEVTPGHRLNAVRYTQDGKTILAGGMQGWVEKWPLPGGEQERFGQHGASINSIHVTNKMLITGSGSPYTGQETVDSTVRVFDLETETLQTELKGHTHPVISVTGHPSDTIVISVDTIGNLLIWDTDDGRAFGYQEGVTAVALSPNGNLLAIAYRKPELRVLKMAEGRVVFQADSGGDALIQQVRFSPDGNLILTAHSDGVARIWGVTD